MLHFKHVRLFLTILLSRKPFCYSRKWIFFSRFHFSLFFSSNNWASFRPNYTRLQDFMVVQFVFGLSPTKLVNGLHVLTVVQSLLLINVTCALSPSLESSHIGRERVHTPKERWRSINALAKKKNAFKFLLLGVIYMKTKFV